MTRESSFSINDQQPQGGVNADLVPIFHSD